VAAGLSSPLSVDVLSGEGCTVEMFEQMFDHLR